jgi:CubicO group peptidase (beta-lactamase class C family)
VRRALAVSILAILGAAPAQVDDGWPSSTPEAEGLSAGRITEATNFIRRDTRGDFKSLVVIRNGRLVLESYFNGHGRDSLHDIRSAAKSITSALVGIAEGKNLVDGVHARVTSFFPKYAPLANDDARKRAITIEHLLTMTSGLDADEDDARTPGYEDRLWEASEWVRFALDLPMAREPGSGWSYASVNTFLAGAIVEQVSGRTLAEFARAHLFGPLGITTFQWQSNPSGGTVGQGNLSLRARDMARIGQLFLEGRRRSCCRRSPKRKSTGARGRPSERMVVVIQSAAYTTGYGQRRSFDVLKLVMAAVSSSLPVAALVDGR